MVGTLASKPIGMAWRSLAGLGRVVVLALALVAGGVAMVSPPRASAQFGNGMGMGGADTSISKRGLNAYIKILELDAEQKEVARDLLEGNRTANKNLQKELEAEFSKLMEKTRESGDWQAYGKEAGKAAIGFQEKAEKLEKGFFSDLKAVLRPEQEGKFAAVERHRRRESLLRFGIVSGMSSDLIDACERAKADPAKNAELKEALDKYEMDLDRLLVNFEKIGKETQKKFMDGDAMMQMWSDPEKIKDMLKEPQGIAKSIRDLNRDASKKVGGFLTPEQRSVFEREIKSRSFPRIYREGHAEKAVKAASAIADLDDAQKDSIKTLKDAYMRDLDAANDAWAKAMEEKEEKAGGRISMMMSGFMNMGGGEDDVSKARKARKDLDEKTLGKLETLLRDEQKGKLPQKTPEKGGGFGYMEDWGWGEKPDDEE